MDIYEIFNNLRYHYEDEIVEFKKAENNIDFDDLGKYFSALSNEANLRDKDFAWLVFGVCRPPRPWPRQHHSRP